MTNFPLEGESNFVETNFFEGQTHLQRENTNPSFPTYEKTCPFFEVNTSQAFFSKKTVQAKNTDGAMEEVEAVEASNLDGQLAEFCCMTSLDTTEARERLELAGWNLEVSMKGWLVAW